MNSKTAETLTVVTGLTGPDRRVDSSLQTLLNQVTARPLVLLPAGRGFRLIFDQVDDAVLAAIDLQRALRAGDRSPCAIGIDRGLVRWCEIDAARRPYGGPLERSLALAEAAHEGQVIVSHGARAGAGDLPAQVAFRELGTVRLVGLGLGQPAEVMHPALPSSQPPLSFVRPERQSLPLAPSWFVGRQQNIATWVAALAEPEVRLLEVFGAGAVGKSRTALHVAELLTTSDSTAFPEGVYWVDLDGVRHTEILVHRLAAAVNLDLQEQPSATLQISRWLAGRRCLIVLDHADELHHTGRLVHGLLEAAPELTILMLTERVHDDLRPDRRFRLLPLESADAAELFLTRAATRPGDELLPAPDEVADVCRLVANAPLAIELAAARVDEVGLPNVVAQLAARRERVAQERPDLEPTDHAVRAALEWAYELLDQEDRRFLSQLAVFAGNLTTSAAEAVTAAPDIAARVRELRRSSFLTTLGGDQAQLTQVLLCGSVRTYAQEKLSAADDEGLRVRQRHAWHFARLAEELAQDFETRDEAAALDALEAHFAELQLSLSWARQSRQEQLCIRLALPLAEYCRRRGSWDEARRVLELGWEMVADYDPPWIPPSDPMPGLKARLAYQLGVLSFEQGETRYAREVVDAVLDLARRHHRPEMIAELINLQATFAIEEGRPEEAEDYLYTALEWLEHDDYLTHGRIVHNLAWIANQKGDPGLARWIYARSLMLQRAAGSARDVAGTVGNLAGLAQAMAEPEQAMRLFLESLAIRRALRDRHGIGVVLHNLAFLVEEQGRPELAVALQVQAERIFADLAPNLAELPRAELTRLGDELGAFAFDVARREAESLDWEQVAAQVGFEPGAGAVPQRLRVTI